MSSSMKYDICGSVLKRSVLKLKWNERYIRVDNNHLKLFKTKASSEKGSAAKYSIDLRKAVFQNINEKNNRTKIEICIAKDVYQLSIDNNLWKKLELYYSELHAEPEPKPKPQSPSPVNSVSDKENHNSDNYSVDIQNNGEAVQLVSRHKGISNISITNTEETEVETETETETNTIAAETESGAETQQDVQTETATETETKIEANELTQEEEEEEEEEKKENVPQIIEIETAIDAVFIVEEDDNNNNNNSNSNNNDDNNNSSIAIDIDIDIDSNAAYLSPLKEDLEEIPVISDIQKKVNTRMRMSALLRAQSPVSIKSVTHITDTVFGFMDDFENADRKCLSPLELELEPPLTHTASEEIITAAEVIVLTDDTVNHDKVDNTCTDDTNGTDTTDTTDTIDDNVFGIIGNLIHAFDPLNELPLPNAIAVLQSSNLVKLEEEEDEGDENDEENKEYIVLDLETHEKSIQSELITFDDQAKQQLLCEYATVVVADTDTDTDTGIDGDGDADTDAAEPSETEQTTVEMPLSPIAMALSSIDVNHNWNSQYQEILSTPAVTTQQQQRKDEELQKLVTQFCCECKAVAVDMIESKIESRSVEYQPLTANTFLWRGILFCVIREVFDHVHQHEDNDICSEDMYVCSEAKLLNQAMGIQGAIPNQCLNPESISRSLLHWQQYCEAFQHSSARLNTPLAILIHYLNSTIFCVAVLPFFKAECNLVFGVNDHYNEPTFASDVNAYRLLNEAAVKLNLSAHACKFDDQEQISTSSYVQVFEVEDEMYVHNVARLYPCDIVYCANSKQRSQTLSETACLRPELLKTYSLPISSDAFIPAADDACDKPAAKLIHCLHTKIIPKFAEDLDLLRIKILDGYELCESMHSTGINTRYLGVLFAFCSVTYVKEIIAIEMIVRAARMLVLQTPITEKKRYLQEVNAYMECLKHCSTAENQEQGSHSKQEAEQELFPINDELSDQYLLNIRNAVHIMYDVQITNAFLTQLSFVVIVHEFERIFNCKANKDANTNVCKVETVYPTIELSVPASFLSSITDINPMQEKLVRSTLNQIMYADILIDDSILESSYQEIEKMDLSPVLTIQKKFIKIQRQTNSIMNESHCDDSNKENENNTNTQATKITGAELEQFKQECLQMMDEIERIAPMHILRLDIMYYLCQIYTQYFQLDDTQNNANNNNLHVITINEPMISSPVQNCRKVCKKKSRTKRRKATNNNNNNMNSKAVRKTTNDTNTNSNPNVADHSSNTIEIDSDREPSNVQAIEQHKKRCIGVCASLYRGCTSIACQILGKQHPRMALIQVQLCKLLHLSHDLEESAAKLNECLSILKSVYGEFSLNVAMVARLLCDVNFDRCSYQLSFDAGMLAAKILEKRKGLQDNDCIHIHLQLALIAEKMSKYQLSVRFLNKLFVRLKKECESLNINILSNKPAILKQNPEIEELKLLALSITRLKLKMANKNKKNTAFRKWKENKKQCHKKFEVLVIQNLCLNPIQKSNDLLKHSSDAIEVAAWINIIKNFEKQFLGF